MNARDSANTSADPEAPIGDAVFPGSVGFAPSEPATFTRSPFPRPILLVALAYIAGLTLGRILLLPSLLPVVTAGGIALLAVGLLLRKRDPVFLAPSSGVTLLVAVGLLGWAASNAALREERLAGRAAERFEQAEFLRIQGRVTRVNRLQDDGLRLRLGDPVIQPAGRGALPRPFPMDVEVVLFGGEEGSLAHPPQGQIVRALRDLPGSRVALWARSSSPDPASHPWDFDPADYHRHQGIGAGFLLPSLALVEIIEPPSKIRQAFNRVRTLGHEAVREALRQRISPEASSIAQAMILGERSAISGDLRTAFRDSGLSHILVVSGLHTAFILGLALFLARLSGLTPGMWAIAGLLALVVFTFWVGFRPPVVRASIMGAFLVGAWWLGRPASTLAGLAAAAFVTLLIDPRNLIRADWQLSYGCVLSLTLLMPPIAELAKETMNLDPETGGSPGVIPRLTHFLRRWIVFPAAAVLAILMGLLPFQAHYFGQINLSTMASNLAAIPLAYATMLSTVAFAALHELPGVGAVAASLLNASARGLIVCAGFFEEPGIGRVPLVALSPLLILTYSLFLVAGPHLRRGERSTDPLSRSQLRHMAVRVGVFFLILAWAPVMARAASPDHLEIYLIDVGQGDAIVLRAPNGTIGVVDGGGGRGGGEGEKTLVPFLKGLGVRRLAFVVATHADADHVGGLDAVIESFDVPLLLLGPGKADTLAWRELMDAAAARRVRVREVRAGDTLGGFGKAKVRFLGPLPGQTGNNASIVMLIDYEEVEILLSGDIERDAEYRLLEENGALDIEVLKVAHHGSATSTTEAFLRAFRPELALISAGRNNRFGHPSSVVLDRLQHHGIAVARTDLHGSLRLITDGQRMRLEAFGPPDGD